MVKIRKRGKGSGTYESTDKRFLILKMINTPPYGPKQQTWSLLDKGQLVGDFDLKQEAVFEIGRRLSQGE